jgi:hypothetical protein
MILSIEKYGIFTVNSAADCTCLICIVARGLERDMDEDTTENDLLIVQGPTIKSMRMLRSLRAVVGDA